MNAITQISTLSTHQTATSVSPLGTQATAQNDISIQMLPISQLMVSELNVRKSKASKSDDESLKASLLAHGVIQNLVALPAVAGVYPVVSGGRRLTQLHALVDEQEIAVDYLVPVKVLSEFEAEAYATEISLTENVTRAAMHPVDEFEAYSEMMAKGETVENVAQRFGKTQLYVHQRMKLAAVSPDILAAYRQGEVTLEKVMLFTIASPEHQMRVWEQVKDSSFYRESQIRNMLKNEALDSSHNLVQFVGQEAYEQAGGSITSDLFSEHVYFDDRALVESLATQKIQLEADKLIEQGWKWTEILLSRTFEETKGYAELTANKGKYKKAEKALAGCVLVLSYGGKIEVFKGLVAKEDRKALKALQSEATKGESGESGASVEADESVKEYSDALQQDLRAHRLVMAKHALMLKPSLAIDVLHFSLCLKAQDQYVNAPMSVSITNSGVEPKQGEFTENKALERIEAHKETVDKSWLKEKNTAKQFKAFMALDAQEREKQVALASAMMLLPSMVGNVVYNHEFLYQELDFDAADYWRPSTDSFVKRLDKAALIEIARPVMSETWLNTALSLKKGELVKQLDCWLNNGDPSLTDEQKAYFAQWMPIGF